jgi:energy-coupling factor transporter ATP-binding protein EcfA2
MLRLIRILKNRYNKIIILITKDTSFCYEIGSYIYIVNENTILRRGDYNILKNTSLLSRLNLRVPEIIKFTKEYKKNSDEIDDYNNILDLIKAIYRDIGYKM